MARKKHDQGEGEHENAERWLLTYADMITLLVAFFILMYSMSVANIKKFDRVAIAIRSGFGGDFGRQGMSISDRGWPATFKPTKAGGTAAQSGRRIGRVKDKYAEHIDSEEYKKFFEHVNAQLATMMQDRSYVPLLDLDSTEGNRIRVIMSDRIWFAKGETTLTEENRQEILKLGQTIKDSTFKVAIDGYSSMGGPELGDGWLLSLERARQVALMLAGELRINPRRLMISGYGEWKDPGRTRKLRMTERGGWEPVDEESPSDDKIRDVVVVSLIVK